MVFTADNIYDLTKSKIVFANGFEYLENLKFSKSAPIKSVSSVVNIVRLSGQSLPSVTKEWRGTVDCKLIDKT